MTYGSNSKATIALSLLKKKKKIEKIKIPNPIESLKKKKVVWSVFFFFDNLECFCFCFCFG